MSELVREVDSSEYEGILASDTVAVVDFWAPWCNPCRALTPILTSLADEFKGKVVFYKINVDEASDLARTLGIRSIPAIFLTKSGSVLQTFSGLTSREKLKEALDKAAA